MVTKPPTPKADRTLFSTNVACWQVRHESCVRDVVQMRNFSTYNVKHEGFSQPGTSLQPGLFSVHRVPARCLPLDKALDTRCLFLPGLVCSIYPRFHPSPLGGARHTAGSRLCTRALKVSLIGALLPFLPPSCCRWLARGTPLAFAPEPQPSLGVGCSARGCEPLLVFAA